MRIKRGTMHLKRRKGILKLTKGYRWGRKSKLKLAQTAILKAGTYAFRDRRAKKRSARRLWSIKINAAVREKGKGMSYSKLINKLKVAKVELDRKVLSQTAEQHPAVFEKIIA